MCDLLSENDPALQCVVLDFLNNILTTGSVDAFNRELKGRQNPYVVCIEDAGALDRLGDLTLSVNAETAEKAAAIYDAFFAEEEQPNWDMMNAF
jgi:hypothetical protein